MDESLKSAQRLVWNEGHEVHSQLLLASDVVEFLLLTEKVDAAHAFERVTGKSIEGKSNVVLKVSYFVNLGA